MKKGFNSRGHSHLPPAHDCDGRSEGELGTRPTSMVHLSPYGSGSRRAPGVCRCAAGRSYAPPRASRIARTSAFDSCIPDAPLVDRTATAPPPHIECSGGFGGAKQSKRRWGAEQFLIGRSRSSQPRGTPPDGSYRPGQLHSSKCPASRSGIFIMLNQPFLLMRNTSACSDTKLLIVRKSERSGVCNTTCGGRSVK